MFAIERVRQAVLLAAILLGLLGLGCTSTTSPEPVPEAEPPKDPIADTNTSGDVVLSQGLDPVYFDTDEARLRPDARRALDAHARAILAHPEWGVITVDGHCDERGSDHYNQVLGRKRADAVERYLVGQGVPRERIETRSFGSERPAVNGTSESAWQMNRRSEFQLGAVSASL